MPAKRAPDGDKTMQIPKLDPAYNPEATQRIDDPSTTQKLDTAPGSSEAEQAQRIDDSIWRLQEAKRILQGVREKG